MNNLPASSPDRAVNWYADHPLIRGLVQLVPWGLGAALDVNLVHRAEKLRAQRLKAMFDNLAADSTKLTPELIESDEFLHCFFATTRASLNAARMEKIELFTKLLKARFFGTALQETDEFEELLDILCTLSFREWKALVLFDNFSSEPGDPEKNELQKAHAFWPEFVAQLDSILGIPPDEATYFMMSIARTGLYDRFVGYWDETGEVGHLTKRFYRLKKLLLET